MKSHSRVPLEVFYDGSCSVCSREMQVYQRLNTQGQLLFIDISAVEFNANLYGHSLEEFMKKLHVRDSEGLFHTGVEAFALIWSAFPDSPLYSLLCKTVRLPGVRLGAKLGYATFARFRYLFPKVDCQSGHCKIDNPPKGV